MAHPQHRNGHGGERLKRSLQPERDEALDEVPDDALANRRGEYFGDVLEKAVARRAFLKAAGALGAAGAFRGAALVIAPALIRPRPASALLGLWEDPGDRLAFKTVPPGDEREVEVPEGYAFDTILRWGDPLAADAPEFDLDAQTGPSQARQFGYNCDLVLWFPLSEAAAPGEAPEMASRSWPLVGTLRRLNPFSWRRGPTARALLAVNHEYTTGVDMFRSYRPGADRDQAEVEIEAHGTSIVEVVCDPEGRWRYRRDSGFNRRTTGSSVMEISGPLRGYALMQSAGDPTGTRVKGSLNNCAGGRTPWGTLLTCEENFDQYFANFDTVPSSHRRSAELSRRIPAMPGSTPRKWELFDPRFDLSRDPVEYNRFGYVVEIDPYDPAFVPRKRTALGRFKHETATTRVARDGRVAVYSGDDSRFEYVYKFVSRGRFDPRRRSANRDLLDEGTLHVARFDPGLGFDPDMGSGEWLPLVWKEGGALHRAGYRDQQEVLLDTRGAADQLGATPMDRPEDIEASPITGRVYIALTNNSKRSPEPGPGRFGDRDRDIELGPTAANPRGPNPHGHIIELIEEGDDAGALRFRWNIFVKCGHPDSPTDGARFGDVGDPAASGVSPISDPDNVAFDDEGNLWIATDGQYASEADGFGQNDGIFAVPVEGKQRGLLRQFLSSVPRAEVCGPAFSGDDRSFFCSIQHPHEGRAFEEHWPLDEKVVSKPSVIGVWHTEGGKIGS
ncbi:MAG: PhoX family phosphatase [Deltaproteobacteria bacterium]|nr:PhoX family phosphatase [Deltaproteobacteria bacterium]MBW2418083.1 PhoX family phosphatase [Deltaproteobacteria bacterium]